jgi:hypothetical protein
MTIPGELVGLSYPCIMNDIDTMPNSHSLVIDLIH